jgi:hypothetical protein
MVVGGFLFSRRVFWVVLLQGGRDVETDCPAVAIYVVSGEEDTSICLRGFKERIDSRSRQVPTPIDVERQQQIIQPSQTEDSQDRHTTRKGGRAGHSNK